MARPNNPRFPHYCRIIRRVNIDPMEDEAMLDEDPMADETESPLEDSEAQDAAAEGTEGGYTVIYEGECRSDNRITQSDNGEVNASYRTLALPLKQDEWTDDTIPLEGDKIELQRTGYKEYGLVIDKRPSNLGTHILWKYVRN